MPTVVIRGRSSSPKLYRKAVKNP